LSRRAHVVNFFYAPGGVATLNAKASAARIGPRAALRGSADDIRQPGRDTRQ
jgi:hypothetical protein